MFYKKSDFFGLTQDTLDILKKKVAKLCTKLTD